jgi:hypothetical protein
MEKILHSQVLQLERQLEQYVAIVNIQNCVLGDVYHLLEAPPSQVSLAKYTALRARVGDLLKKQKRSDAEDEEQMKTKDKDSPDIMAGAGTDRPSSVSSRWQDVAMGARDVKEPHGRPTDASQDVDHLISGVSKDVAARLQTAVVRLLSIWFTHLSEKVSVLLEDPAKKFENFHNSPTEDSLAEFMDSFQASAKEIRDVLRPAAPSNAAHTGPGVLLGPAGNPFEIDGRLENLFMATIRDGYAHIAKQVLSSQQTAQQVAQEASSQAMSTNDSRQPELSHPNRQVRPDHLGPSSALASGNLLPVASTPPISERKQPPAYPTAPTPTPQSRSSSQLAATPRAGSRQNDSSQIRLAMFGGIADDRPSQLAHHRLGPSSVTASSAGRLAAQQQPKSISISYDTERLAELRSAVHRIEMQLSSVASLGRDSGSEAKYYALAKRLQRLRADLVKEQRECDEVRRVEEAKTAQREENEEHRRLFRR